jgi:hypothetical protein
MISLLSERLSVGSGEFSTVDIGDFTTVVHSQQDKVVDEVFLLLIFLN